MKQAIYVLTSAIILSIVACNSQEMHTNNLDANATVSSDSAHQIKRGAYLVSIMGCNDCHTPKKFTDHGPVPDMERMLSGYDANIPLGIFDTSIIRSRQWVLFNNQNTAFAGPWGVSFAANITPDATGIGNWSVENFKKAMREGKFKGIDAARTLFPPMPWQSYKNLTDEDLESIFTFLKSIKPINNRVPETISL